MLCACCKEFTQTKEGCDIFVDYGIQKESVSIKLIRIKCSFNGMILDNTWSCNLIEIFFQTLVTGRCSEIRFSYALFLPSFKVVNN